MRKEGARGAFYDVGTGGSKTLSIDRFPFWFGFPFLVLLFRGMFMSDQL